MCSTEVAGRADFEINVHWRRLGEHKRYADTRSGRRQMTERVRGLSGITAVVMFWTALFSFAAAYPGYSHSHKAISELGAFGAPHALAWNLIGFITPGLLLAVCGAGIARAIEVSGRKTAVYWLLVMSGVGFAGTGVIPAEMRHGSPFMQSPFTVGHVVMTLLSSIPWTIAAFLVVARVNQNPAWQHFRRISIILAVASVAGFALNVLAPSLPGLANRPGLGQRISFGIYFAWFLIMAGHLLAVVPRTRHVPEAA